MMKPLLKSAESRFIGDLEHAEADQPIHWRRCGSQLLSRLLYVKDGTLGREGP